MSQIMPSFTVVGCNVLADICVRSKSCASSQFVDQPNRCVLCGAGGESLTGRYDVFSTICYEDGDALAYGASMTKVSLMSTWYSVV